jgi:SAM-dependent methyltransferase
MSEHTMGRRVVGYVHEPTSQEHFPLSDQLGALNEYCSRRGWILTEIIDPPENQPGVEIDLTLVEERLLFNNADTLIVPAAYLLNLRRALPLSYEHEWSVVATNESIDTTTEFGRQLADELINGRRLSIPPPTRSPLPPSDLIARVAGHRNVEVFDLWGYWHLETLEDILARQGRRFSDFSRILDFGCGCGRLLRRLPQFAPEASFIGVDIDPVGIAWLSENIPSVMASVIDPLPPVALPDNCADLVIAFSVFTHLDESYQDAWLSELARLISPGGYGLITVQGARVWERDSYASLLGSGSHEALASELSNHGFAYWMGDGWEEVFPDFYHTAYHADWYVKEHWDRWFHVIAVAPGTSRIPHDVVVVQAR